MKDSVAESRLLASVLSRGIERPLSGVSTATGYLLLDGFKRYRCAHRLNLNTVPLCLVGLDEASGILSVLAGTGERRLGILEEAQFLQELNQTRGMNLGELATALGRSKAWVSMRLGLLEQMSDRVRGKIFSGAFSAYAYMHIIRPFMRMNGVSAERIDTFVTAVSGRQLSVREIEQLANGYFRGPEELRREIEAGKVNLVLGSLREVATEISSWSERERNCLKSLGRLLALMDCLRGSVEDERLEGASFLAEAHILLTQVLGQGSQFLREMRRFYDRCGSTPECISSVPARNGDSGDSPAAETQP